MLRAAPRDALPPCCLLLFRCRIAAAMLCYHALDAADALSPCRHIAVRRPRHADKLLINIAFRHFLLLITMMPPYYVVSLFRLLMLMLMLSPRCRHAFLFFSCRHACRFHAELSPLMFLHAALMIFFAFAIR